MLFIELKDLFKSYGAVKALQGLSLNIPIIVVVLTSSLIVLILLTMTRATIKNNATP